MKKALLLWLTIAVLIAMLAGLACAGEDEGSYYETTSAGLAGPAGSPGPEGVAGEPGIPQVTAAAAPAASGSGAAADAAAGSPAVEPLEFSRVQQSALAQNRVIIHTARLALVVTNVAGVMDGITGIASSMGGWIVSADRSSASVGSISLRVPSGSLDAALDRISSLGILEESRAISSQDVTEDFVDSQSRLASMRATERRLLSFLERANTVEEALLVQEQLTILQQDIEQTQGRINALSERAAFSLIEVTLRLTPIAIGVDAGPDFSARAGEQVRFQATFSASSGIDRYNFSWDFGDGTQTAGSRTALTPEGNRITATVSHTYADDSGSPYIVNFSITGSGDGGIVEGSDSLLVTVKSVPPISLFAGDDRTVEEGKEVDFSASFTRPEELTDFEYRWDFGDGSATVQGIPEEGATRVTVPHTYEVYHPRPYTATVTVTALSEAGLVTATESFQVRTSQAESFIVAGWDITGTTKAAVRALSVLARAVTIVIIWVLVFSPVFLVIGVAYYVIRRFRPEWLNPRIAPAPRSQGPGTPQNRGGGAFPRLSETSPTAEEGEQAPEAPAEPEAGEDAGEEPEKTEGQDESPEERRQT